MQILKVSTQQAEKQSQCRDQAALLTNLLSVNWKHKQDYSPERGKQDFQEPSLAAPFYLTEALNCSKFTVDKQQIRLRPLMHPHLQKSPI